MRRFRQENVRSFLDGKRKGPAHMDKSLYFIKLEFAYAFSTAACAAARRAMGTR